MSTLPVDILNFRTLRHKLDKECSFSILFNINQVNTAKK